MKVDFPLLFQKTGIFRTRSFVLSCDFSLRYFRHMASVVFSFVICSCSNVVTFSNCFSNFVNVSVDFFVLEFRCAVGSRKSEIAFSSAVVDSINFSSFQRHWDVAAPLLPREQTANQDCHGTSARSDTSARASTSCRWLPLFCRADQI